MDKDVETAKRFFKEMSIKLSGAGYAPQKPYDGYLPVVWRGEELCRVTNGGGVRFREADLEREGARAAFEQVVDMTTQTHEYMRLMENAPPLAAAGLDETYKVLADFNGAVLAAHPTSHGVQLITWEWGYDHNSVYHGHYFSGDYAGAKTDFAIRANILERDRLFSPEQQTEVYRAIHETLDSVYPMTAERQKLLESAAEQIERTVPDLDRRIDLSNQRELELVSEQLTQALV